MKTKFTPKQIANFQSMIYNGILEYICSNSEDSEESEALLTNIGEKFAEVEEGRYLREQITDSQVIEAACERGELGYLADASISRYCKDGNVGKDFAIA